jgi:insertion element IS1 protein InsB
MVLEPVKCPSCNSIDIVKHGSSAEGKQRYKCRNAECSRSTFIQNYSYRGYLPEVKTQIADMAVNGSGIRDTARVLKISPTTVIEELNSFLLMLGALISVYSTSKAILLVKLTPKRLNANI